MTLVKHNHPWNFSEPMHPDLSLLSPNPFTPASPVMPSPKESVHGESSDDFKSHNNPHDLLPSAFVETPRNQLELNFIPLSLLTLLTVSSATIKEEPLSQLCMPQSIEAPVIKKEEMEPLITPNSIR